MKKRKAKQNSKYIGLQYIDGNVKVIDIDINNLPETVAWINTNNGTWHCVRKSPSENSIQTHKIGHAQHIDRACKWGIIGVYNRDNTNHIDNLWRHARDADRATLD